MEWDGRREEKVGEQGDCPSLFWNYAPHTCALLGYTDVTPHYTGYSTDVTMMQRCNVFATVQLQSRITEQNCCARGSYICELAPHVIPLYTQISFHKFKHG